MEKPIYEVIPEEKRIYYTREELREQFDGKWLFITDYEFSEISKLLRAKVAVVSDESWGGYSDGVYEHIHNGCEYGFLRDDEWGGEWD